eukprot:TRINITY_DN11897_c0_g3_i1.p2 TRINITY_DN11897_c0_g3~~TRINITY_DN11897_c0_g3_i1.p2  ORF type:complete len:174 (-),score=15.12 TRINITY_DN11897_c0_g3_i1:56-577(-)
MGNPRHKGDTRLRPKSNVAAIMSKFDRSMSFQSGPNEWTLRFEKVLGEDERKTLATSLKTCFMLGRVVGEEKVLTTGAGLQQFKTDAWERRYAVRGAHRTYWRLELEAALAHLEYDAPYGELDAKWGFDLHPSATVRGGCRILYGLSSEQLLSLKGSFPVAISFRPLLGWGGP